MKAVFSSNIHKMIMILKYFISNIRFYDSCGVYKNSRLGNFLDIFASKIVIK